MINSQLILFMASMAAAFVIVAILGPVVLPLLRKLKAGQSIREEGPESHQIKAGTPTMGGIMIIFAIAVVVIVAGRGINGDAAILLMSTVLCGAIGFIDDFIKVVKKRNLGLRAYQKLLLQIIIAVIIAVYETKTSQFGTSIYIPIWRHYFDLGVMYIPFIAFVLVAMTNAVNLTDGLDGLAAGCSAIVAAFIGMVAVMVSENTVMIYCAAMAGACLGFMIYNRHPAKVFMGDTGSLALGSGLATAAIAMHVEMILVVAGGIFVAEAASVIIQVVSFKTRHGKRVFRMAPLHHHFELGGWKETKVVRVFWLVTVLLCVLALVIL